MAGDSTCSPRSMFFFQEMFTRLFWPPFLLFHSAAAARAGRGAHDRGGPVAPSSGAVLRSREPGTDCYQEAAS